MTIAQIFTNTVEQLDSEIARATAELKVIESNTSFCEYNKNIIDKLNEIENYKIAKRYIEKSLTRIIPKN